jgi:hypothetical protein
MIADMRIHILGALLLAAGTLTMDAPSYEADVQPILERHCYECHGPSMRKGGLRLSSQEDALLGGDTGAPLVAPGDPEGSTLIQRVTATDPADRMPPTGGPVPDSEVATLRAWIAAGAEWPAAEVATTRSSGHWAFQAPDQPAVPVMGVANPIDAFVQHRLMEESLSPTAEADRYTLLRRLSLDLTGLPPTPEEIEAFVEDQRPHAYERQVERLLASPHYGERRALHWLDAARYADTNGYEKDRPRSIWPYRDWVIGAFNSDMPYDQFVIEQLAGDLLPAATESQRIATGFLRNSMHNEEGGVDVDEFRYEAVVDRTNTVSTVFLGLTMACAQCHTHKFDPVTQREYFQLLAFLNNTDDGVLELPQPEVDRERERLTAEIVGLKAGLEAAFPAAEGLSPAEHLAQKFEAWEADQRAKAADWQVLTPVAFASKNNVTFVRQPDKSLLVRGNPANTDTYTLDFYCDVPNVSAIRIEALPDPSLPAGGPGRGVIMSEGDFLLSEVRAEAAPWDQPETLSPAPLHAASHSYAGPGRGAEQALDGKVDTGWGIQGRAGEPHAAVFNLAAPLQHAGGTLLRLTLDQYYVHEHILGRFRVSVGSAEGSVQATAVPAELEVILRQSPELRSEADAKSLKQHYLEHAPELAAEHEKITAIKAKMPAHPSTLVLEERMHARSTRVHHRGEYLEPRETVEPGVPEVLHPLPETGPRNRMTLARWLVATENPLLARVTVNRLWQQFFGRGLASSVDDFGLRGELPSHPELLDWLAIEFQRRGWSVKEMVRLIVMSAAYRQDSAATPELIERDPANELLARGPRFRLPAELVRDTALAASGLLNERIGGPSVYPSIPDGFLNLSYGGVSWPTSEGPDRYRRGIYTYVKRTLPYPTTAVFDAPARDATCVRRIQSNTPLQALTLLNDAVFLEAAGAMAAQLLARQDWNNDQRIAHAFLLAVGRPPDANETEWVRAFHARQLARFQLGEADPATVLEGADPAVTEKDSALAAWTLVCRALLNLDETITKS